jgi:hypothetical protein
VPLIERALTERSYPPYRRRTDALDDVPFEEKWGQSQFNR